MAWPLIRVDLWLRLLKSDVSVPSIRDPEGGPSALGAAGDSQEDGSGRFVLGEVPELASRIIRGIYRKYTPATADPEVICFSRPIDHTDRFQGRLYDRHIDPMLTLVRNRASALKVEVAESDGNGNSHSRRFTEPVMLDPGPFTWARRFRRGMSEKNKENLDARLERLDEELQKIAGLKLDPNGLVDKVNRVKDLTAFFRSHLKKWDPSVVFLACHYDLRWRGLLCACSELGIKTVEIQHGKQGRFHGAYTHWTHMPENGYKLLPDLFWEWGKESVRNIQEWMPAISSHRAIVGGSVWLGLWKEGLEPAMSLQQREFIEKIKEQNHTVLVSLQPPDPPVPDAILGAMKITENTLWLLRAHPRQTDDDIAAIKALIEKGDVPENNYEIRMSSEVPLCALLREVDNHVTAWSSVCYEALTFGVPTVIIHPSGADLYSRYIELNLFDYATSGAEIVRALNARRAPINATEGDPYIVADLDVSRRALEDILDHAGEIPHGM